MRAHAAHLWEKSKGNKTSKNVRLGPQQVQRSFVSVLELFENTVRGPEAGNGVMGDGTDGVLVPLKSMWKPHDWASLVAQWLRIRLPMQETWVWSLVQEDSTCCWATNAVAAELQPLQLESAAMREGAAVRAPSTRRKGSPAGHSQRKPTSSKEGLHDLSIYLSIYLSISNP